MPWQLQENADISMARSDAPCDERPGHRSLVCASPRAIRNPLQLLLRATPPPLPNEIDHYSKPLFRRWISVQDDCCVLFPTAAIGAYFEDLK